jgi:hypothetical protein
LQEGRAEKALGSIRDMLEIEKRIIRTFPALRKTVTTQ